MGSQFKIQKLLPFTFHPKLRAIIANVSWLFFDRILRMGISLFVGVWVARYLGVQQYGLFNYAIAFVALFSPLTTLGVDNIVIRELVRDSSNREKILGTTFWLKILGGFSSLLLATICILLLRQDDILTVTIVVILATAGIFEAVDTIDLWFESQVQSKYTVVARNVAFLIIALVKVALIQMQAPLIAFAWTTLAEIGFFGIGLAIAYKIKGFSFWLWRWSFPLAKTLLKQSKFMILSNLGIIIYMQIDQIMLGQMVGNKAVGIYSVATRISEVWYFIPMAILASVSPAIFAAKETHESLYYKRLKQFLIAMMILSVMITVPMTFLSGTIITMLFGASYSAAGAVLAIHIWSSFFIFIGVAISPWFIAEGLTHLSMYRTLIGAITNIILNLFLIPAYAETGAAISTVISYAFTALPPRKILQSFFIPRIEN
ncbi:MAG: flippase [Calothrix sp. MO_192.B10]|nr:flippase [Calothrix sp. MO_192.B10]